MRISFDLDSTIIPNGGEFEIERIPPFRKLYRPEKIRVGAIQLFRALQQNGHSVHIYTTSYRKTWKVRLSFWCYGLRIGTIINEKENRAVQKSLGKSLSKYPPAFGFDLHIDDLPGVGLEGERNGFNTVIVNPSDQYWVETILSAVQLSSTLRK